MKQKYWLRVTMIGIGTAFILWFGVTKMNNFLSEELPSNQESTDTFNPSNNASNPPDSEGFFDRIIPSSDENQDISTGGYGVSAAHPLAVQTGMDILEKGGNAVDAAVAVSYVLGVVEPYGSGIGGGGIMLVHPGQERSPKNYHYREVSPLSGDIHSEGIGVPGFVKGMEYVHERHGQLDLAELLDPAIQLAEDGFEIDQLLEQRLTYYQPSLRGDGLRDIYPNNRPVPAGELMKQPQLARTLRLIQEHGSDVFYEGEIAKQIAQQIGTIEVEDLKAYDVVESEPVIGQFAEYEVISTDTPTSGTTLIQSLQMADMLRLEETIDYQEDFITLIGHIGQQTYADRLSHIADPRFVDVPQNKLVSEAYSRDLAQQIKAGDVIRGSFDDSEADVDDHNNTTHFVIVDQDGMMVSATNTLSQFFGSGYYVNGFFMNNQLKNFSSTVTSPNAPEPGKSPRTYMAPTILAIDGQPILGIGTPGGKRIPMMLVMTLVHFIYTDDSLQEATERSRFFVEDNVVSVENYIPQEVIHLLHERGFTISYNQLESPFYFGGIQALYVDTTTQQVEGAADPRRGGVWQSER